MKIDKNKAELWLNDQPQSKLPQQFRDLINKNHYYGTKNGRYIRSKHAAEFDKWFAGIISGAIVAEGLSTPDSMGDQHVQAVQEDPRRIEFRPHGAGMAGRRRDCHEPRGRKD